MRRISAYAKECYNELMHKVTWPTWNELQDSAVVVLIATAIFGLLIFSIDFVFQGALKMIYDLFG